MLMFKQMTILFLLMLVGFICRKINLFSKEGNRVISALVVNVANPALILSAGINKETTVKGTELFNILVLAIGMYFVLILIALLITKMLHVGKEQQGVYQVMTVFSNIGFMGFPVISAVYGEDALLYASLFLVPYNILIYTFGISSMGRNESGNLSMTSRENSGIKKSALKRIPWTKILNVGVISCILTMIIYIAEIPIPSIVESTTASLANLTAPLSMMIIGASMADMKIKELFCDWKLLIFSVIKLLLLPIAGVAVLLLLGLDRTLCGVCMIMLATPVGSMTAMLAQQYHGDYELASKGVALTTVLSVITMPLVSFLLGI
ncbi:MAG: AEC family transporter [Lachnospiraceae bacterium]